MRATLALNGLSGNLELDFMKMHLINQASTIPQIMPYVSTYALGNLGARHVQGEIQTREKVQKAKTRKTSVLILIK